MSANRDPFNIAALRARLGLPLVAPIYTPSGLAETLEEYDFGMADIEPDPVEWIKFFEDENRKLTEELDAANAKLRAIMTAPDWKPASAWLTP